MGPAVGAMLLAFGGAILPSAVIAAPAPDAGAAPPADSTEAGLWNLADREEKLLQASPRLVKDNALNAYVHGIVCAIAGPDCTGTRVYVVTNADANAQAWANGTVEVWTGLLLRTENEAQLAFVLGHELTHFQKRHALKRFESARDTSGFLAAFSVLADPLTLGLAGTLADLAATGALFSYTREQEAEADEGGFDRAVGLGYDPRQAAVLWKNMVDEEESNPKRSKPSRFFSSHPSNEARLSSMAKRADQIETRTHATNLAADAFRAATLPYRSEWLNQELERGAPDESLTVIARLLKADADSVELKFFQAEAFRQRNGPGDLEKALIGYQSVAGKPGVPAAAWRGLGLVALKAKQNDTARQAFQSYLENAADADDRDLIRFYLTTLGN